MGYFTALCSFCVALFEAADVSIVRSNKNRLEKINAILESLGIKYRVPDTVLDDAIISQLKHSEPHRDAATSTNK